MPRSWTIEPEQWDTLVTLPRSPREWHESAKGTKIGKGIWSKKTPPDPDYPKGRRVCEVPLRQLGGWGSGSKVQQSHFLTARILWEHVPLKSLVEKSASRSLELAPEVRKKAMECSREFYHFLIYCEDIRAHGGIKPKDWDSNLLNLGPFSAIRSLQFTIRREKERPNESDDAPSTNTRSRTAQVRALDTLGALPNPSPNQADHGRSSATLQDEDMREAQDPSNGSDPMSTDGDSDSAPSKPKTGTKHPKEGSGESGGFTGHIKEFSGESATVPQTSEQVNSEKVIESTFIFLLHTLCLKLGNLDLEWSPDSPQSKVTLGKASIVAAHDGQLKCSKSSAQPEAIVEVKASVLLASHAQKVLMQMGIEMMIWMLKCHTEHQPKKGYVMFCQHGHEIWIVVGKCGPEYFKYLLKDDLSREDEEAAFLTLKLYGPFDIFNSEHMLCFGPLVVGVTLQRDMDYKARTRPP